MTEEQEPESQIIHPTAIEATTSMGIPTVTVTVTAAGEVSEAPTTSIGLPVTRTIIIKQAYVTDTIHQYEAIEDGKVVWSGVGDDPVEGFLQIVMRLTEGEDPNHPNN
jgi:hypothetical protein